MTIARAIKVRAFQLRVKLDLEPAGRKRDVGSKIGEHGMAQVLRKADLHPPACRSWLRLGQASSQAVFDAWSRDHGVEKSNQGSSIDKVSGADRLDVPDGLHQALCRGPADREEVLDILAAPGLGPGRTGPLPQQMKIECPLDWPRHGKDPANRLLEGTG